MSTETLDNPSSQLQRGKSLTELVVKELERMILKGELKAGERINEHLLAVKLGISRGPIREARRALERAGLVVGVANRGLFVRKLDRKEVAEMYDVRALLTGLACERVAKSATAQQIAELRRILVEMQRSEKDADRYFNANLQFHQTLMQFADHAQAKKIYDDLAQKMHLVRRRVIASKIANAEHAKIVEAIAGGKPALARQLGTKHVLGGKARWLEHVEQ